MAREIVVVHLGAGIHDVKDSAMYRSMCENACKAAKETLNSTSWPANTQRVSKAFHAVLAAISTFEDDPKLNCGYGSNLTLDQTVECDASVMDGKSKLFGGIGALEGIRYPIRAAGALVQAQTTGWLPGGRVPPMLLCGSNALPWFMQYTPSLVVPPSSLISDLSLLRYHAHLDIYMNQCEWEHALNHDTVGAVVMDSDGQVAAGVSSGGISLKYKGRVGEAAMYGAGCWAETLGSTSVGVSCSGTGESIMQALLAKSCSTSLLCNPSEFGDLRHVFDSFLVPSNHLTNSQKSAGVIALSSTDSVQELHIAHTTPTMVVGYWTSSSQKHRFVYSTSSESKPLGFHLLHLK